MVKEIGNKKWKKQKNSLAVKLWKTVKFQTCHLKTKWCNLDCNTVLLQYHSIMIPLWLVNTESENRTKFFQYLCRNKKKCWRICKGLTFHLWFVFSECMAWRQFFFSIVHWTATQFELCIDIIHKLFSEKNRLQGKERVKIEMKREEKESKEKGMN